MLTKRFLLLGAGLVLAYGLKGLAAGSAWVNNQAGSSEPPRLSDFILPLPPLELPELLLPPYNFPSFNSERLDQELQLYLRYLRTHGKPDILITGSSRSLQGIDPAALEEALAEQGHPGLKVYNFGINGATAQVMSLLLRQILKPEQLPRLIIWGDGSRAFNSGRPDRTYTQILASAGYQRLAKGDYPIPSRTTDWEIPTFVTTANKSLAGAVATITPTDSIASDLSEQGFQTVTDEYDPSSYYRRFPRVAGQYDNNYENFTLGGEQTKATIEIAQFARKHDIKLVFVNLPLARDYLDTARRNYEARFQQHMWQLAARQSFMFRDLSQQPELTLNQFFADPSHINQHGARAVAFYLAADKTLPWQVAH
jgi:hypothetical protein